jgi:hypothetical protein
MNDLTTRLEEALHARLDDEHVDLPRLLHDTRRNAGEPAADHRDGPGGGPAVTARGG